MVVTWLRIVKSTLYKHFSVTNHLLSGYRIILTIFAFMEDNIQASIVTYFNNNYCLKSHNQRSIIFSVPNGGYRNKIEANKLKATGLLAGVSDLILIHEGQTIFIEVKKLGGKQQHVQVDFQNRILEQNLNYFIVHSLEEFKLLPIFTCKIH
jgi:hypothetical protein